MLINNDNSNDKLIRIMFITNITVPILIALVEKKHFLAISRKLRSQDILIDSFVDKH